MFILYHSSFLYIVLSSWPVSFSFSEELWLTFLASQIYWQQNPLLFVFYLFWESLYFFFKMKVNFAAYRILVFFFFSLTLLSTSLSLHDFWRKSLSNSYLFSSKVRYFLFSSLNQDFLFVIFCILNMICLCVDILMLILLSFKFPGSVVWHLSLNFETFSCYFDLSSPFSTTSSGIPIMHMLHYL